MVHPSPHACKVIMTPHVEDVDLELVKALLQQMGGVWWLMWHTGPSGRVHTPHLTEVVPAPVQMEQFSA